MTSPNSALLFKIKQLRKSTFKKINEKRAYVVKNQSSFWKKKNLIFIWLYLVEV